MCACTHGSMQWLERGLGVVCQLMETSAGAPATRAADSPATGGAAPSPAGPRAARETAPRSRCRPPPLLLLLPLLSAAALRLGFGDAAGAIRGCA